MSVSNFLNSGNLYPKVSQKIPTEISLVKTKLEKNLFKLIQKVEGSEKKYLRDATTLLAEEKYLLQLKSGLTKETIKLLSSRSQTLGESGESILNNSNGHITHLEKMKTLLHLFILAKEELKDFRGEFDESLPLEQKWATICGMKKGMEFFINRQKELQGEIKSFRKEEQEAYSKLLKEHHIAVVRERKKLQESLEIKKSKFENKEKKSSSSLKEGKFNPTAFFKGIDKAESCYFAITAYLKLKSLNYFNLKIELPDEEVLKSHIEIIKSKKLDHIDEKYILYKKRAYFLDNKIKSYFKGKRNRLSKKLNESLFSPQKNILQFKKMVNEKIIRVLTFQNRKLIGETNKANKTFKSIKEYEKRLIYLDLENIPLSKETFEKKLFEKEKTNFAENLFKLYASLISLYSNRKQLESYQTALTELSNYRTHFKSLHLYELILPGISRIIKNLNKAQNKKKLYIIRTGGTIKIYDDRIEDFSTIHRVQKDGANKAYIRSLVSSYFSISKRFPSKECIADEYSALNNIRLNFFNKNKDYISKFDLKKQFEKITKIKLKGDLEIQKVYVLVALANKKTPIEEITAITGLTEKEIKDISSKKDTY